MILEKEIYVIDNFIDTEYQEDIRNILMGNYQYRKEDFPWYYTEDVTGAYDSDSQHRTALGHDYVIIDNENLLLIFNNFSKDSSLSYYFANHFFVSTKNTSCVVESLTQLESCINKFINN